MSQDAKGYIRENGWNWTFTDWGEKPKPRPTHWKYGASVLLIPRITVYHK